LSGLSCNIDINSSVKLLMKSYNASPIDYLITFHKLVSYKFIFNDI